MREIKFRAWDGRVVKNVLWVSLNHSELMFVNNVNGYYKGLLKNCELMQYTGEKDKNGVEIYEGDIVKGKYGDTIRISFGFGCFLTIPVPNEENWNGFSLIETNMENYQVIGNIYENPELLEIKK